MSEDIQKTQPTSPYLEKTIDFLFSKDSRKWLLVIVLAGFVLRILTGLRVPFNADEMVHGTHAIGFINSGKLQIMDQDALWFWLTDFSMRIFGVNILGIRFLSIIFGSLALIAIYLIGKEIYSEKAGLLAAAFLAFSPFQLLEVRAEMDVAMTFFVLVTLYFSILFFKRNQRKYFILSWMSLGIAIMTKQIALVLIPVMALFTLYYNKKHFNNLRWVQIFYAALIILILVIPVLAFNYLLYKDKKILDVQFARFTRRSLETYAGIASTMQPFSLNALIYSPAPGSRPGIIDGFFLIYDRETLLAMILALIGFIFVVKNKNRFTLLLVILPLTLFAFLSGTSLLSTHFVWASSFIALFAGIATDRSTASMNEKNKKIFISVLFAAIVIWSSLMINAESHGFFGKNELGKMIDFKELNIPKNAWVIADSRIYRGRIVFMFWDRHYLEANYFPQVIQEMEKIPGETLPVETYFIQCVPTDCGWGTVKNQPEFNQSMENIVSFFKDKGKSVATINDVEGRPYFQIYKQTFSLKSGIFEFTDSTHEWFYYPVAYQPASKVFDSYSTHSLIDRSIDNIAHIILYAELFMAVGICSIILYCVYRIPGEK